MRVRLIFAFAFGLCAVIAVGTLSAEMVGGTLRGHITDTTTSQAPIEGVTVKIVNQPGEEFTAETDAQGEYIATELPAGRYLISIYKEGYGDRLGKPVTIVNGGDHYVPLKMTKRENIVSLISERFGLLFSILFLCGLTALITFLFTRRWMAERSGTDGRRR